MCPVQTFIGSNVFERRVPFAIHPMSHVVLRFPASPQKLSSPCVLLGNVTFLCALGKRPSESRMENLKLERALCLRRGPPSLLHPPHLQFRGCLLPPSPSLTVWTGLFSFPWVSIAREVKAREMGGFLSCAEEALSWLWVQISVPTSKVEKMPAEGNAGTRSFRKHRIEKV